MNGHDWYPAEYPPENLKRAVEAVSAVPGLRVKYTPSGRVAHGELEASSPSEFYFIFYFYPKKGFLSHLALSTAEDGEFLTIDPLGYEGNGVPPNFEEFLDAGIEAGQNDWILGELVKKLGREKEAFAYFYDTFLKTLYATVEHHELHTDVGPYDEAVSVDNAFMRRLTE